MDDACVVIYILIFISNPHIHLTVLSKYIDYNRAHNILIPILYHSRTLAHFYRHIVTNDIINSKSIFYAYVNLLRPLKGTKPSYCRTH